MFSIKPFPVVVRKCSVYNSSLAARNECVHISRGRSRAAATSKIECFVLIANGFQPLTIITKHSILDVAAVLDPPLVSVNHTIWKASVTHFSECALNVCRKVFKVVLSSLSVNTVSVNVVKVTTTPTYRHRNPVSKHVFLRKPVFSAFHVNTLPAPAVVTLISSLPLHVCDVPVPANLLCHVRKVTSPKALPVNLTTLSRSH